MKTILFVGAFLLLFSGRVCSQVILTVKITGLMNNTGKIMLQVFDAKENVIRQETGDIKDRTCSFTVRDLLPGKYAVRFYHDENLNQIMEKNLVGKPTEGYGFSNNVTGKFGMPPFEKWLFDLKDDKIIEIRAVY